MTSITHSQIIPSDKKDTKTQTDQLIACGYSCNVSFALQRLNLKGPSGIFEWVITDQLSEMTTLIKSQFKDISCERFDDVRHLRIKGTNIWTGHYEQNQYNEILLRRSKRFLDDLKKTAENKTQIVFIRRDSEKYPASLKDIASFFETILQIQPGCNCRMLLISVSTPQMFVALKHDRLIHLYLQPKDIPYGEYWNNAGDISLWSTMISSLKLNLPIYEAKHNDTD
jgi:hypothetical protein